MLLPGLLPLVAAAYAEAPADVVAPSFVQPFSPAWPADAPAGDTDVVVQLELHVEADGTVSAAAVVDGPEPFATAARTAALAARLDPAREGGVPVAVDVPLTVTFVAPPVNLRGVVRLAGGGAIPVAGATVRVAGELVATDALGQFERRGLPPGSVVVEVVEPGYSVAPATVEIAPGAVAEVELYAAAELGDAGIVGHYRAAGATVRHRALSAEELRALPGTLGDPLRALANLPGTSRSPLDTGWLLVRGGDPRDTAVYLDGVRLPLVYHLGGFTSVLHPAFVGGVELLPEGGGVRYGRSLAGTVEVEPRPAAEHAEARVGANLVFAGAYASYPQKTWSVSAAARRSYLDAVLTPVLPEGAGSSIPRFWDWAARADLPAGAAVTGLGFADTLNLKTGSGGDANLEIATERVQGHATTGLAGRSVRFTPFLAWEHLRLDVTDWEQTSTRDHWGGGLRVEVAEDPVAFVSESVGVDLEAWSVALQANALSRTEPVALPDAYAALRVGHDAQLVAGVRLDTLLVGDQPARAELSPRLSGALPLTPWLRLDAEGGLHHEPPPWELVLGPPEGADLELDEAWSGSLGLSADLGPAAVRLEGYARQTTRLTMIEADGSLGQGEGLAYGAEGSVRLRRGRLDLLGRLGWGRSFRREEAALPWTPSPYDQPITVGIASAVDLGRRWTVGGRFRYASGFYVGEAPLLVYDALTATSRRIVPVDGRVEAFHALDVKVQKRFVFRTWRLDAWLDLQNVYNHRVPEPVVTGFSDLALTSLGFGLVTLPVFGVEGQWGGDPRSP